MPGPTPTQRIEELRRDLDKLTALVEKNDAVNTVGHKALDEELAEMKEGVNSFREKFTDFLKSSVDHEGRIKALEKASPGRWRYIDHAGGSRGAHQGTRKGLRSPLAIRPDCGFLRQHLHLRRRGRGGYRHRAGEEVATG